MGATMVFVPGELEFVATLFKTALYCIGRGNLAEAARILKFASTVELSDAEEQILAVTLSALEAEACAVLARAQPAAELPRCRVLPFSREARICRTRSNAASASATRFRSSAST